MLMFRKQGGKKKEKENTERMMKGERGREKERQIKGQWEEDERKMKGKKYDEWIRKGERKRENDNRG